MNTYKSDYPAGVAGPCRGNPATPCRRLYRRQGGQVVPEPRSRGRVSRHGRVLVEAAA